MIEKEFKSLVPGDKIVSITKGESQYLFGDVFTVKYIKDNTIYTEVDSDGSHTNGWSYDNFDIIDNTHNEPKILYTFK